MHLQYYYPIYIYIYIYIYTRDQRCNVTVILCILINYVASHIR